MTKADTLVHVAPPISLCLNAGAMGRIDAESETLIPTGGFFDVAHSLRADGFDASEDGTGRGTPIVAAYQCHGSNVGAMGTLRAGNGNETGGVPFTLAIRGRGDSHDLEYRQDGTANAILTPNGGRGGIGVGAIAFSAKDHGADAGELAPTLRARGHDRSHANGGVMPAIAFNRDARPDELDGRDTSTLTSSQAAAAIGKQVRRLTPRECERLQGFPDDYTLIPYRGKPAADGPRYKALGNSMAVQVMRWIGRQMQTVDALLGPSGRIAR